jgi:hypothetical protein
MSISYQLLAILVVSMLLAFSGYRFGVSVERGEAALREHDTAVATANELRDTMERDAAADLAAAQKAAARRAAARAKSHALELEIARDETARNCRVSDGTLGLLNDAIDRANGAEAQAGRRDGGVPAAAAVAGTDRGQPGALDHGYLGELRRLPSQSPAAGGVGGQ